MLKSFSFVFLVADIEISDNVCDNNAEGIRLSMGSSYNKIFDNEVTNTEGSELNVLWLCVSAGVYVAILPQVLPPLLMLHQYHGTSGRGGVVVVAACSIVSPVLTSRCAVGYNQVALLRPAFYGLIQSFGSKLPMLPPHSPTCRPLLFRRFVRTRACIVKGALWMYLGSDPVEASEATEGRCTDNLFQNNHFETSSLGVMMRDTRGTQVIGNTFIDTDKNEWEDSDGLVWKVRDQRQEFPSFVWFGAGVLVVFSRARRRLYACCGVNRQRTEGVGFGWVSPKVLPPSLGRCLCGLLDGNGNLFTPFSGTIVASFLELCLETY